MLTYQRVPDPHKTDAKKFRTSKNVSPRSAAKKVSLFVDEPSPMGAQAMAPVFTPRRVAPPVGSARRYSKRRTGHGICRWDFFLVFFGNIVLDHHKMFEIGGIFSFPLVSTNSLLLQRAIEIVSFPIKHSDFP